MSAFSILLAMNAKKKKGPSYPLSLAIAVRGAVPQAANGATKLIDSWPFRR
jgi:hypothetical protein